MIKTQMGYGIKSKWMYCDDCMARFNWAKNDPQYIRREAQKPWNGWVRKNGKDLCRSCSETLTKGK